MTAVDARVLAVFDLIRRTQTIIGDNAYNVFDPSWISLDDETPPIVRTDPALASCPGSLPQRVAPGEIGIINGEVGVLRVRATPGGTQVGRLRVGMSFVVDDFECGAQNGWLHVTAAGMNGTLRGWVAESDARRYFISPISPGSPLLQAQLGSLVTLGAVGASEEEPIWVRAQPDAAQYYVVHQDALARVLNVTTASDGRAWYEVDVLNASGERADARGWVEAGQVFPLVRPALDGVGVVAVQQVSELGWTPAEVFPVSPVEAQVGMSGVPPVSAAPPSAGRSCAIPYFFTPPPELAETCPRTSVVEVDAAFEEFQGGCMFWRGDTRTIYAMFLDGSWAAYAEDVWLTPGQDFPDETPPPGLFQPVMGFEQIWWKDARERLGWATTLEIGYVARIQESAGDDVFFTWPDGRIIGLLARGRWTFVQ